MPLIRASGMCMEEYMRQIAHSPVTQGVGVGEEVPLGRLPADAVPELPASPPLADGEFAEQDLNTSLNASDAVNLAYIVSHRFARNAGWRLMLDQQASEAHMAELAARVSKRLEELSLRIADDSTRAELGVER
ncbi:MAG: hypothetical protein JW942_04795 [Opitutales bacterium]|nr:hypothetical protein [Opitutales bacterium]